MFTVRNRSVMNKNRATVKELRKTFLNSIELLVAQRQLHNTISVVVKRHLALKS